MPFNRDTYYISKLYTNILFEATESEGGSKTLSSEELTELHYRITRCIAEVHSKNFYFGNILLGLKICPTYSVDTMAVDDMGNIYINPYFGLKELSEEETTGVLAHEAFHVANATFFRQHGRIHKLWNIATDYIMNRDLVEGGFKLPSIGCIPENKGGRFIIPKLNNVDVTDMDAEQLYDVLKKESEKQNEQIQKMLEKLSQMQEQLDKHLDSEEASNIETIEIPGLTANEQDRYEPKSGEGMTPQQKADQLREVEESAYDKTIKDQQANPDSKSSIPRSIQSEKSAPPVKNWKAILQDFIKPSTNIRTNMSTPRTMTHVINMKGGSYRPQTYLPKVQFEEGNVDLYIAIDTSGSISKEVLGSYIRGIVDLLKQFKSNRVKLTIIFWHTNAYNSITLDSKKLSPSAAQEALSRAKIMGGGTEIGSVKEWFDKHKIKLKNKEGICYFTDGHVNGNNFIFPGEKQNRIFMINKKDGNFDLLKPFGKVYRVEVGEK